MHSLNDLRVVLGDPVTQVYVLEALRSESSKFDKASHKDAEEFELGLHSIKSFLTALIDVVLQCQSQSVLAEVPGAHRLCQTAYKVAKILLV